jgi:hypothetical protein
VINVFWLKVHNQKPNIFNFHKRSPLRPYTLLLR